MPAPRGAPQGIWSGLLSAGRTVVIVVIALAVAALALFVLWDFVSGIPELIVLALAGAALTAVAAAFGSVGLSLRRCYQAAKLGYWSALGLGDKLWAAGGPVVIVAAGYLLVTRTGEPLLLVGYFVLAAVLALVGWAGIFVQVGPEEIIGESSIDMPPDYHTVRNWETTGGRLSVSGPLSVWLQTFQAWHSEDTGATKRAKGTAVPIETYWPALVAMCGSLAVRQWQSQANGQQLITELQSCAKGQPDGPMTQETFMDYTEFLAEHLPEDQLKIWAPVLRAEAKKRFQLV